MAIPVICTTLLIEKSPQALPLGAACIASAIKNSSETKELCKVSLKAFSLEDDEIKNISENLSGQNKLKAISEYISDELLKLTNGRKAIICISTFVWNVEILKETAIILKKHGCICIAGGPEITAHPSFYKEFDYSVSGEGELSLAHQQCGC